MAGVELSGSATREFVTMTTKCMKSEVEPQYLKQRVYRMQLKLCTILNKTAV